MVKELNNQENKKKEDVTQLRQRIQRLEQQLSETIARIKRLEEGK